MSPLTTLQTQQANQAAQSATNLAATNATDAKFAQPTPSPTPVSTPTSVVSDNSGANQQLGNAQQIVDTNKNKLNAGGLTQAEANARDATATTDMQFLPGSGKPNPNYVNPTLKNTPTTPNPTDANYDAEQNAIENSKYFNMSTGQPEYKPTGGTYTNYSTTDPNATIKNYTAEADTGGETNIRQITNPDGSTGYVRVNTANGTYAGQSTAEAFQQAKDIQSTNDALRNARNNIYSASQQAQIAGLQQQFQDAIDITKRANSNATGALSGAEALWGTANSVSGQQDITSSINDGVKKITDLITKEQAAVSAMEEGFISKDESAVKTAYDIFTNNQKDIQASIDKTKSDLLEATKYAKAQKDAADLKTYNEVTKPIQDILAEATKMGVSPTILEAIKGAKTVDEAINAAGDSIQTMTGDYADYPQYRKDTLAKGLVPSDATTWLANKKAIEAKEKASAAYNDAYNAEKGKQTAINQFSSSDKNQQKLEQEARGMLAKEFSSRSGTYGLNDAKVSQANKLAVLFNQGYDPKTGNYNINKSQYGELAIGLASLISNSNVPSDSSIEDLKTATAKGDWNKVYTYVTSSPANGSSQDIINSLAISVDREAKQAEADRQTDETKLVGMLPTDLDPARKAALIKNASIPFVGIKGISDPQAQVENFIKSPEANTTIDPSINTKISSMTGGKTFNTAGELGIYMSGLKGATPDSILSVLKGLGLIK